MKYTLGLVVAASALMLVGCGKTVNTLNNAYTVNMPNMISDARIESDYTLSRKIAPIGVNTGVTPGGLMRIQVTVENMTNRDHSFFYQIDWFDEQGMILKSGTSGIREDQILARATKSLTAVAPTQLAKDFKIQFKEQ